MGRTLTESFGADGPALRVDEEKGVIYGVKVLGPKSKNRYVPESEGTDYPASAMRAAIPLYEGVDVNIDHAGVGQSGGTSGPKRTPREAFGKLRSVRYEEGDSPGLFADLHYLQSHDMAPLVVEDVKKRLEIYGLSHCAKGGRDRFDPATRRLVIEEIAAVHSVDLVRRAATNRNLWESDMTMTQTTTAAAAAPPKKKTITLRKLIESQMTRFIKGRKTTAKRLVEMDDSTMPAIESPVEVAETGGDPDDELWNGFKAAMVAVMEKYKSGDLDSKAAIKQIAEFIKSHEGLSGDDEPSKDGADAGDPGDESDKLEESTRVELHGLREREKVRVLCESMQFAPNSLQVTAIAGLMSEGERKELIESMRAMPSNKWVVMPPMSVMPGTVRPLSESQSTAKTEDSSSRDKQILLGRAR